jgi:flagellar basal-body rod protein FlgB
MIDSLFNSGSLPVIERLLQFTSARHQVLVNNIANLSTPGFQPTELDPKAFQAALSQALDQRRQSGASDSAPLEMKDTAQLRFTPGSIEAHPEPAHEGILFHDGNNRDLERLMQHLVENTITHNVAVELMRSQFATIRTAIRERL